MVPHTVLHMDGNRVAEAVGWDEERVRALAPDTASHTAADRLAQQPTWSEEGAGQDAVWGACKGSGSRPYRTVVDLASGTAHCTCPSRKLPCKHALALLLRRVREPLAGVEPPEWAGTWLAERRRRAARGAGGETERPSQGSGRSDTAARRARREARIAAGAEELEQRLADLLGEGLSASERGGASWEETAARMVDAQAPGLASRVRELTSVPGSGERWPERLLSECALLHLLDRAFLATHAGSAAIPPPLAETVRSRVGLTVETARLLSEGTDRLHDRWLVLAQRDTEEERLTARRTWLRGCASGRTALLLSFRAPGRPPEPRLPCGWLLEEELVFHPGAAPLRAARGEGSAPQRPAAGGAGPPGTSPLGALRAYGEAVRADPWLERWPAVLESVVPVPPAPGSSERWQLAAESGESALPVASRAGASELWRLTAVSGGRPVKVFGECGHQGFVPYTVWSGEEVVAL